MVIKKTFSERRKGMKKVNLRVLVFFFIMIVITLLLTLIARTNIFFLITFTGLWMIITFGTLIGVWLGFIARFYFGPESKTEKSS